MANKTICIQSGNLANQQTYSVVDWDGSKYVNVSDIEKKEKQVQKTYWNVTFLNSDLTQYGDIQTIEDGYPCAKPENPTDPSGKARTFKGWSNETKLESVTSDLTCVAQYYVNAFLFSINGDGNHSDDCTKMKEMFETQVGTASESNYFLADTSMTSSNITSNYKKKLKVAGDGKYDLFILHFSGSLNTDKCKECGYIHPYFIFGKNTSEKMAYKFVYYSDDVSNISKMVVIVNSDYGYYTVPGYYTGKTIESITSVKNDPKYSIPTFLMTCSKDQKYSGTDFITNLRSVFDSSDTYAGITQKMSENGYQIYTNQLYNWNSSQDLFLT